jgi:hypothetical protein
MTSRTSMPRPLRRPSLRLISSLLLLLLWAAPLWAGHLYTYVDREGVLHITDLWRGGSAPVRKAALPPSSLEGIIQQASQKQGLDPSLVKAVIQVESGFNPGALSSKGAVGLMQLMPDTARLYGVKDPWDTAQNVKAGTAYLRDLIQYFDGDLEKALAAYNAGPKAVKDYGGVPPFPETQKYVREIFSLYPTRKVKVKTSSQGKGSSRPIRRIRLPDGTVLYTNMPGS